MSWRRPSPFRHRYRDDGSQDADGLGRCTECGTPERNARHVSMPVEIPAAATEIDQRTMGEAKTVEP